ncbi:MAG TPA: metallopeptidase TldD-related protein [Bryobacteraceae bacterium]|jgi:hypothetical protein|nr:metallopeptidase TldD-related protein [Bryobacteraceae bacterium]
MRGRFFAIAVLVAVPVLASDIQNDTQLRAMVDELARAKTIQLSTLEKPYFIQYTSSDSEQAFLRASLGGLLSSSRAHLRQPRLEIRVGDYKFDNTNSIFSGTPSLGLLPIDDDYQAIRTELWLSTDGLYKAALDQITRKRNALRDVMEPENTPDLAPAKPVQVIAPPAQLGFNQKRWETIIRDLSAHFCAHPDIATSSVQVRAVSSTYRLANSEGTVVRIPQEFTELEIRTLAIAPDGKHVWNHQFVTVPDPSELPSEQQLTKIVDGVASETDALSKAPAAEDYTGPVLFEGEAAAQLMAQVLTDAARLERKPVAPQGASNPALGMLESVWITRMGSKVAPEWMTIVDDPRQQKFHGTVLAGAYQVDDQGVPAQRVTIVDKGTLKGFLLSREPVGQFNGSNGHGRLPGGFGAEAAVPGNVFVQADQPFSEAKMKARLIDKIKLAGLKYGLIVRRLDFPSTANFEELQSMARQLEKSGYSRTLNSPILAYRVYPDGHEELVRGARFREFSARDLRDVDAASDKPYVLNYVTNVSSFNLADSGADVTTSSVICPSLLFESLDLARAEDERAKPPMVPPPPLAGQ